MLEDSNIALKVLLDRRDRDKVRMEENILANVRKLVTPYLEKLRFQKSDERNRNLLAIIAARLEEITSPFLNRLTAMHRLLTPREIDVAVLVREGKTSKEMAELLDISVSAVDFHRKRIRKRLGLTHKKSNLRSYLLSLHWFLGSMRGVHNSQMALPGYFTQDCPSSRPQVSPAPA